MTIDGHVCFHRCLFADPFKPWRCTTYRARELVNTINRDVCDVKLLPTTVLDNPVDFVCFCLLLKTYHCCLCVNIMYRLRMACLCCSPHSPRPPHPNHLSPTHLPPYTCHLWYYSSCEKVVQNPAVLVSRNGYKPLAIKFLYSYTVTLV